MEEKTIYDSIIIGAGPAGMTSAIYLLRAGMKVLILEKSTIGGGIASTPMIENYPGIANISGSDLADNMFEQVTSFGGELEVWEAMDIVEDGNIDGKKVWKIKTDGPDFFTKTIIIATGTKYRRLGLPKEEDFVGHGINFCVTCDGAFYKDQVVAVIGGGNSAVTNALELSGICKKVIMIQNLPELTCEKTLSERVENKDNIDVICNATVKELIGDTDLRQIKIQANGKEKTIDVDGMFLAIGLIPATDFIKSKVKLNKFNYIDATESCNTNLEGIFTAGDVRNKAYHQITTSTSDGTVAALEVKKYLEK